MHTGLKLMKNSSENSFVYVGAPRRTKDRRRKFLIFQMDLRF